MELVRILIEERKLLGHLQMNTSRVALDLFHVVSRDANLRETEFRSR